VWRFQERGHISSETSLSLARLSVGAATRATLAEPRFRYPTARYVACGPEVDEILISACILVPI